jgi:hypothetical protein
MKHTWQQSYDPPGKYNRLYRAQQMILAHNELIQMDRKEPITDVTQALAIIRKFQLGSSHGN